MIEKSRIPSMLMERVLGIGVAVIAIVSISIEFPKFFFLPHSKTMFFINDYESKIFEFNISGD